MIGYYDYSMFLTYLSAVSAVVGVVLTLSAGGHPHLGTAALLLCGLCDAFDGKVARTKKSRTRAEMDFGIQIDSLSDLVAFGVLPTCIGTALIRVSPLIQAALAGISIPWHIAAGKFLLHAILVLYSLAAMIRLAYYNVSEHDRQEHESGARTHYLGLPVTSAALIFPLVLLFQYLIPKDITLVYLGTAVLTGILFLTPFRIRKVGLKGILIMVGIGAVEFLLLLVWKVICR